MRNRHGPGGSCLFFCFALNFSRCSSKCAVELKAASRYDIVLQPSRRLGSLCFSTLCRQYYRIIPFGVNRDGYSINEIQRQKHVRVQDMAA